MLKRFFPDIYIDSVFDLPLTELKNKNIKALFFDIDNTVAPFDEDDASEEVQKFFEELASLGYKLCLFSNNSKKRVEKYNLKLNVYAVHTAGKPGIRKLQAVLKELGVTKEQAAFVGDQVFTDMYCAYRVGMLSILTKPICDRDQLITKVKRSAERWVLKAYERSLLK